MVLSVKSSCVVVALYVVAQIFGHAVAVADIVGVEEFSEGRALGEPVY